MLSVSTRFLSVLAIVSFSIILAPPTGRTLAQGHSAFKLAEFPVEKLPEPDPAKVRFDNACALFAGSKLSGVSDNEQQQWLSDCSRHPDIEVCQATKRFIEDADGHPVPELICKPGSKETNTPPRSVNPEQQPDPARSGQIAPMPPAKVIVKGQVTLSKQDGYVRLVFRFDKQVGVAVTEADTSSQSSNILVLRFSEPVDVAVQQLTESAPDLITAARRDPDGAAIRIALVHRVKLQTIPTGKIFFLDLLPENWTGLLPSAPE